VPKPEDAGMEKVTDPMPQGRAPSEEV